MYIEIDRVFDNMHDMLFWYFSSDFPVQSVDTVLLTKKMYDKIRRILDKMLAFVIIYCLFPGILQESEKIHKNNGNRRGEMKKKRTFCLFFYMLCVVISSILRECRILSVR